MRTFRWKYWRYRLRRSVPVSRIIGAYCVLTGRAGVIAPFDRNDFVMKERVRAVLRGDGVWIYMGQRDYSFDSHGHISGSGCGFCEAISDDAS